MMNLLVIGHSVVDKIYDGKNYAVKPGGIFYSTISMMSFLQSGDKLFLCTNVDKPSYNLFSTAYDNVEQDFIRNSDRISTVQLTINNAGERDEKYENISENLKTDFPDINKFDGILVNMITGFDISLEQLEELRKRYKGIIYFDVHTLSRGADNDLNRTFMPIPHFDRWACCIDILQTNEVELKTLSNRVQMSEIVEELLDYGINQVIITRADRGSEVFFRNKDGVETLYQDALQTETVNKVGCGDVFGAVYFYNYIRNKKVSEALMLANLAAGISTRYVSVQDYLNLKNDVRKQFDKT